MACGREEASQGQGLRVRGAGGGVWLEEQLLGGVFSTE